MADFQKHRQSFDDEGILLLAISADDREGAGKMQRRNDIDFKIGYGVDPRDFAERTGCFIEPDDGYFHACGFVLKPDGTVRSAVYSAGAIGRFRPEESIEQVKFFRGDDD